VGGGPLEPALALATFDSAWSRIHNTYYDTTFKGMSWPAVRDELRPRAGQASTPDELRAVLTEMLERLGDSHFAIIPAASADALDPDAVRSGAAATPGTAGIELRVVDGALVVTRVAAGSGAAAAGIRTGWAMESVDGREAARWLLAVEQAEGEAQRNALRMRAVGVAQHLLDGPEGSRVTARFRDAQDRVVEREITRGTQPGEAVRFGNLPTVMAHLEHERVEVDGGCVGVIRFDIWMTPINAPLERAIRDVHGCRGVVLDLRGNPGGVGGMAMGVAGYFLDEVVPFGLMQTRQQELRFVSNPRRATSDGQPLRPFAGPLAILVDGHSASTSEIFAAGMQVIGRARIFGETSAGMALPAHMVRLPNDDVLYHAVANFTDTRGERIEGRGAIPDERVPLSRAALLAGRDAPLQAALAWIQAAQPASPGR
jgi:carboxyl-terminal processing protease